jgi:hypothetical protein
MKWKLVSETTGEELRIGDVLTTIRGEKVRLILVRWVDAEDRGLDQKTTDGRLRKGRPLSLPQRDGQKVSCTQISVRPRDFRHL